MNIHETSFDDLKEWTAPATHAFAITKSDSTILPACRGLYIGSTGNVAVEMLSGATVTFVAVPIGIMPIAVRKVLSTGTTAASILGLY